MTYLSYTDAAKLFERVEDWTPLRVKFFVLYTFNSYIQLQSLIFQLGGPILLGFGLLFLLIGCLWWLSTLQLCNEHLRHTQPHHVESRKIFVAENEVFLSVYRVSQKYPLKISITK